MTRDDSTAPPTLEQRARRRVALKNGFFIHALVCAVVNGGLYLMALAGGWAMGSGAGWAHRHGAGLFFPGWGWALGLAIHGTVVFLRLQGEGMTERRVEREIESLKRRDGAGAAGDKALR